MKRIAVRVLVVVVASLLLVACGSGPKDVAKDFVKAMEDGDGDKMADLFCDREDALGTTLAGGLLDLANLKFEDVDYDEDKSGDEATVKVSGKLETLLGSDQVNFTLKMKKEDGDWCITEMQ